MKVDWEVVAEVKVLNSSTNECLESAERIGRLVCVGYIEVPTLRSLERRFEYVE